MSSGSIYSLVTLTESSKLTFRVRLTTRDVSWLLWSHLVSLELILLSSLVFRLVCSIYCLLLLFCCHYCFFCLLAHNKIFAHRVGNTLKQVQTTVNKQCNNRLMHVKMKNPCRTSASCKLAFCSATYSGKKTRRETVKMYGKATSGKKLAVSAFRCMLYVINGNCYGDTV